ncbi:MAG: MATE family efflux transporter [Saprospiraceae bacterium]|nr:MATE family efflux transporter [Saprospiraceae bacterium]
MKLSKFQYEILTLAGPIIAGQLSHVIVSITDAIKVGHLGHKHLASSSLMISIISIPSFTMIGFCILISSLTATRRAQNKHEECASLLFNCGIVCTSIASFVVIIINLAFPLIYHFGQQTEIIEMGRGFFTWLSLSLIPYVIFLCIKQFYDGLEKTKVPMVLSIISIILNVAFNYIFIYGYFGIKGYGLEGSGIASFFARTITCLALITHLLFNREFIQYGIRKIKFSITEVKSFLKLALPSSWQYTSEVAAFSFLAILAGWFGPVQQASHQIAITVATFSYVIFVGFSTACSIKIAESFGHNNFEEIKKHGRESIQIALVIAFVFFIFLITFKYQIVLIFNNDQEVVLICNRLLILAALFQFSDCIQALGIGLLRGIQDIKIPTYYTTIAYWIIGLPIGYILAEYFKLEVYGIWLGFIVCLTSSALLLMYRFNYLLNRQLT